MSRRRLVGSVIFVIAVIAFLYFGLPKIAGLGATLRRLRTGNIWWLGAAAVAELLSYVSYAALFRAIFLRHSELITFRVSVHVAFASVAATRVLAAGGAGGIALTAWVLARAGVDRHAVAARLIAFLVFLYSVYMGALVVDGFGLYLHLWPGRAPLAITVVPAVFGAVVIALFLAISAIPGDFERLVARWSAGPGRLRAGTRRLASAPAAAASGVQEAMTLLGEARPGLLGALGNWGFDIACLWAAFHAFGYAPPVAVVIMAYFVGWLANLLPIPGGVGGVEGGLIGAFSAFGVSVQAAIVAVLAYRALSFWLPTLPGIFSYLRLRRTVRGWNRAILSEA